MRFQLGDGSAMIEMRMRQKAIGRLPASQHLGNGRGVMMPQERKSGIKNSRLVSVQQIDGNCRMAKHIKAVHHTAGLFNDQNSPLLLTIQAQRKNGRGLAARTPIDLLRRSERGSRMKTNDTRLPGRRHTESKPFELCLNVFGYGCTDSCHK